MKKITLLLFSLILTTTEVICQDLIIKKNSETIKAKVLEVNQDDIKYKKWDNLEGPTYTLQKSDINSIVYQNGDADVFGPSAQPSQPSSEANSEVPDIDIYQVINDPTLFFDGEVTHLKGFEANEYTWWGNVMYVEGVGAVPRSGKTTSMATTRYHGYVFCENASQLNHDEMYNKIKNKQAAYITHSQFKDYLKTHDYELCQKYKTGQGLYISGWVVSGIGWAADYMAIVMAICAASFPDPELYDIALPAGIIGGVFTAVGIPLLISGAVIQHRTVPNLYNNKYAPKNRSMTWKVGTAPTGMAFSLNF